MVSVMGKRRRKKVKRRRVQGMEGGEKREDKRSIKTESICGGQQKL